MDPIGLYCWEHQSQEEAEVYTAGSTNFKRKTMGP